MSISYEFHSFEILGTSLVNGVMRVAFATQASKSLHEKSALEAKPCLNSRINSDATCWLNGDFLLVEHAEDLAQDSCEALAVYRYSPGLTSVYVFSDQRATGYFPTYSSGCEEETRSLGTVFQWQITLRQDRTISSEDIERLFAKYVRYFSFQNLNS